jgi:hypothetical protein
MMAEPGPGFFTLAIGGVGISAAAATFLEAIGVPAPNIFWGLIGAGIGLTLPKGVSRIRAALMFPCAAFAAGLLGGYIAKTPLGGGMPANIVSLLVGVFLHQTLNKLGKKLTGDVAEGGSKDQPQEPSS